MEGVHATLLRGLSRNVARWSSTTSRPAALPALARVSKPRPFSTSRWGTLHSGVLPIGGGSHHDRENSDPIHLHVRPPPSRRISSSTRSHLRHATPPPRITSEPRSHWDQYFNHVGAEPGIDSAYHQSKLESSSHPSDSHLDVDCTIKVIDYSASSISTHDVSPRSLETFLSEKAMPKWASCRWVHVNGLNLNVIKRLGVHKGLHRLAIEDVLDTRTPTKVDWYENHCFMVMTLQKLVKFHDHRDVIMACNTDDNPLWVASDHHRRRMQWRTLAHQTIGMSIEQVSIFLTSDNTVITIFENSGHDVLEPILERLQSEQSMVRSSKDPSMLVQAIIDAVVDLAIPISKAAAEKFGELEVAVLKLPTIAQAKHLYILRSGLTHFMDNMIANGGLLRTICDHTGVSAAASASSVSPTTTTNSPSDPQDQQHQHQASTTPPIASVKFSPMARIYLQDVRDHITALLTSTRESIRATENLTTLIFNTIAASQNESVRKLTLLSSFFLPLTFLTGYFGMNFDPMPIVNNNDDTMFWYIATPVMLVAVLFLGPKPRWARMSRWRRTRGEGRWDPNRQI